MDLRVPTPKSQSLPQVNWIAEPEQLPAMPNPNTQAALYQVFLQYQEWLARYDRQRLARDIYTLLYLTGGGNDAINYATASNQPVAGVRPVYTDDQFREMAQFAVNLVDALDPDTNITVFEYDKDLSNGWNLDDNAYDGTADPDQWNITRGPRRRLRCRASAIGVQRGGSDLRGLHQSCRRRFRRPPGHAV